MIIKSLISRAILKYVPFYCIKCIIFDQLIFRKIINFVATICRILRLKFTKINSISAWAPPQTPLGELTALPRPPSWWGGGSLPPPQEPHPRSGSSGLALRPFGPQYLALRASKFSPSGLNLPPQILQASAVPAQVYET